MKFLTLTILFSFSLLSMDIPVQGPRALGQLKAHYDGHDFWVEKLKRNNIRQLYHVERWRLCEVLRSSNKEQLQQLIQHGYLQANKNNAGEYSLTFQGRIKGGGAVAGEVCYWTTKIVCWGIVKTGISTMIKKVFHKEEPAHHYQVSPNSASNHAVPAIVPSPANNTQEAVVAQIAGKVATAAVDYGPFVKPVSKVVEHGIKMSGQNENAAYLTTGVIATTGAGGLSPFIESICQGARKLGQLIPWF